MSKGYREVLDSAARRHIPDDMDLSQRIMAHFQKRNRPMLSRMKPALYAGLALIAVLALYVVSIPDAALALRNLFDFIPGVGIVDESVPVRALMTPVPQTKDGITMTVQRVILTKEKTSVTVTITGLTPDMINGEWYSISEQKRGCWDAPKIQLPDGTIMLPIESGTIGYSQDNNYQYLYLFGPLSADVTRATLNFACVPQTRKGQAPENWTFSLQFALATSDLTVLPVTEIETAPNTTMLLTNVIETQDGYIFVGIFRPILEGSVVDGVSESHPYITDANGRAYAWSTVAELNAQKNNGDFSWAYQIHAKDIAFPITIKFNSVDVTCTSEQAQFGFDAGSDFQKIQNWTLNKSIEVGECPPILLNTIASTGKGYIFKFRKLNESILGLVVDILGYPATKTAQEIYPDSANVALSYSNNAPIGNFDVLLSSITISVNGPWDVQWQPNPAPGR